MLTFLVISCVTTKSVVDSTQSDTQSVDTADSHTPSDDSDTAAEDTPTLNVEMTAVSTSGNFYGVAEYSEDGNPGWVVCDPSAVIGGACYLVDTTFVDLQEDSLSAYTGGLSFLGVSTANVGDGVVCSSDYSTRNANGRLVCWHPVFGEDADVDSVLLTEYAGNEGAYFGTASARISDGSLWISQTGDGENSDTVAIFEYDEVYYTVTPVARSVCHNTTSFGAMDMLPFGDGVLASCPGIGASYVTRDGVQWYWDAREQAIVLPEDVADIDDTASVEDRVVLSPWVNKSGESFVIVGSLIGANSGYINADGRYAVVAGYSYAQVETTNGIAVAAYSIAYASDGESVGTLWVNYLENGNDNAQVFDLPFEQPYTELWKLSASKVDSYILATGVDSSLGAVIQLE